MATVNIVVKHQGKKYDVEVDTESTGEVFKYQLFSLTGVEPERQKILIKGGQLKDDAEMGKFGLKAGQTIMMLGTPGDAGGLVRPKEQPKFLEDMSAAEMAKQAGATPAGLENMGNTCYLNSSLQVLRSIPELQESLGEYEFEASSTAENTMPQLDLTTQLRELWGYMSETPDSFVPISFLNAFRLAFPQFAERSKTGHGYAQQDAEEAYSQILSQLRQKLTIKVQKAGERVPFVDRYMAGELTSTLECDDPAAREAGEEPVTSTEKFLKLNCHIDANTNHLRDGLVAGLTEKIEKKSAALDRDATYTKTSKISHLPKYLNVHFVRFFWRRDVQKKAKIMRKVTFPQELDVVEFCTDELKKALVPVRDKVREIRKEEEDIDRARKRRKKNPALDGGDPDMLPEDKAAKAKKDAKAAKDAKKDAAAGKKPEASGSGGAGADGDTEMGGSGGETYKTDAEWDAERDASLLAAKKELYELIDPELRKDKGANQSGLYELRGLITHQGASADSGHYTAYIKKSAPRDPKTGNKVGDEDGKWWWFNDDKVSEVPEEKIATLAGGGESHSALVLLYRAIPLPSADGITN